MLINILVRTNSKKESVELVDGVYVVYTKSPAKDNKANIACISLLSDYFDIQKNSIVIKRGLKSKKKVVEIKE